MKTTILKIGKFHVWVSGSREKPYTHIYYDTKKTKHGYKSIDWYPIKCVDGKYRMWNQTPKWLQWFLKERNDYRHRDFMNVDEETNEQLHTTFWQYVWGKP